MKAAIAIETIGDQADDAMSRYAVGEDDAFDALYGALAPRLYRYLLRLTRDPARAEDLLQQTMLQIHCKREIFFHGAEVAPWAFAIARRLFIDNIRKHRREVAGDEWLFQIEPAREHASDELLHAKRVARTLEHELSRLPDQHRVAFEMIKLKGLSVRQVADTLGISVNAVKLRAHRAYVALRACVSRNDVGPCQWP
ncbi:MAG TPA: RNA polymerase sigma factor [Polyangia bacterium]|jgi:RNA polymerase sigma-70 factor (ECF subfamily)|nr:RNA polymerase sigma factor [Polyangia bacterium]